MFVNRLRQMRLVVLKDDNFVDVDVGGIKTPIFVDVDIGGICKQFAAIAVSGSKSRQFL